MTQVTNASWLRYDGDVDDLRLDLALAFLNTRDGQRDMLATVSRAGRWLAGDAFTGVDEELRRLLPEMRRLAGDAQPGDQAVAEARAVRNALLAAIDGAPPSTPPPGLAFSASFALGEPSLVPQGTGLMALAEHAWIVVYELTVAGVAERLRRCHAGDCRWVYFDRSRNRSKVWCDMSGCGSRAKARAYRRRRAEQRAET
jgi:predicted RNA-binding Zn ribbon-like protein